ncbi:sigma factor [Streptomyces sp. NPDC005827]|uniref:sigma factor n=1 Tax=Streptomyces sp. NPDC005827 TaxID=3157070 RepID=UPI0033E70C53
MWKRSWTPGSPIPGNDDHDGNRAARNTAPALASPPRPDTGDPVPGGVRGAVRDRPGVRRAALVACAEKLLSDRGLIEDIVQEAIVRAWRHSDNPRCGQGSVRSRLLKVTRDLIIDRSRGALVRY